MMGTEPTHIPKADYQTIIDRISLPDSPVGIDAQYTHAIIITYLQQITKRLDALVPQEQLKEKPPEHPVLTAVKRVLKPGGDPDRIKVRGADELMVFRARCCNPIRGEKIVGYITRGKGVSVHSAHCPNVINLMFDPERRIDVEWDTAGADQAPYTVRLTMQVEDRKGMLAEISAKVSNINTNITNMEARTGDDQQARIDMTVEIRDVKHLDKVIKSIKGVQGVLGVERTARA